MRARLPLLAAGALVAASVIGLGLSPSAGAAPLLGEPLPGDVLAASSAPAVGWTPDPAHYGVGKTPDVAVKMIDGTVLRGDVYYPTLGGQRAEGRFPVLLTMTPYSRWIADQVPESVIGSQLGGPNGYLVRRGYISVVFDARGTGASGGSLDLFDPVLGTDGATVVDWAARVPGSNGKVGMYGSSYLAVTQLLTAAAVGENSPLKVIFPVVAPNDHYQDFISMGGLINTTTDPSLLALDGVLPAIGTVADAVQHPGHEADALKALAERAQSVASFDGQLLARMMSGEDVAFNDEFWQSRSFRNRLQRIVDNGIAAYFIGGHHDLGQRGQWLNYTGLQNAFAGRPVDAPMLPDQQPTGRYQLLVTDRAHFPAALVGLDELQLRWFDTFLKDRDTGMTRTPTPLHVYDLGTGAYVHGAQYPFPPAKPTRYYLSGQRSGSAPLSRNDGTLSTTPPDKNGADSVPWLPVGNPCNAAFDQWTIGALSMFTHRTPLALPCLDDDRTNTIGLDRLAYTSEPLSDAQTIAGPITMALYASSNRSESAWVVQVDDVAPDGSSKPLTQGALLGSLRALDPETTWHTDDGQIPLQAGHTYSRASQEPVPTGTTIRYDIEVFPTYNTIAEGHRIRVTVSTADTPHLLPTIPAMTNLLGGVYSVERSPQALSAIQLPLIPAG